MAGNSFGEIFRITTFGESHGPAMGVIIDGAPPNIRITERDIQFELDKRRPGQSSITTERNENDTVEILSGVFEQKTTGTPLTLLIRNKDQHSQDYSAIKDVFRPGHADFTFFEKFGMRDYRGGGRSSGRETVCRVAAGAVAKKILREKNINIVAYTLSVNDIFAKKFDYSLIEKNPVRTPDADAARLMIEAIEEAKANDDSLGGIIEAVINGCPAGLGDPVFDKLDAYLAHAVMSIGAVKGIEFGSGFRAAQMKGSQHNDKFFIDGEKVRTTSNHAGGILGGISNGERIILRAAVKPTSSIRQHQETITKNHESAEIEVQGRHDPCLLPRIVPVVESMIAIVLLDRWLVQQTVKDTPQTETNIE